MLYKQIIKLYYPFARSRIRRQIKFDPKLKNYSQAQDIQDQINSLRQDYQQSELMDKSLQLDKNKSSTSNLSKFSEIIQQKTISTKGKHRLDKKFHINEEKLNKDIKKTYKQNITRKSFEAEFGTDFDYLQAGRSHLYDQKQEIEFEEKFREKLFKVKETKRIISNKQKDVNNYLQNKTDQEFIAYQDAKTKLKNNRIRSMMNFSRNNQQLQLLIESGMMNNPDNIKLLIEELENERSDQSPNDHHKAAQQNRMISGSTSQLQSEKNVTVSPQHRQQTTVTEYKKKQHSNFLDDVVQIGPQQLQDKSKIIQFTDNFQQMSENDRATCKQDLSLLKQIKQYEDKVFISRYEAINYRFKGRVKFNFFKQQQLASYIKNEKIEPTDLLALYDQNKNQISKFNLPIITPKILNTIYSKTSLYVFPENDTNNRINMLNDKLFQKIEQETFKNIYKVSDEDYCSSVWAYAKNHAEEQGVLNPKATVKINLTIYQQFKERMYQLNEADLALVIRAITKLPLIRYQQIQWGQIIDFVDRTLVNVQDQYTMESLFLFLSVLPVDEKLISVVEQHIEKFKKYEWAQQETLNSFIYCCGLLLRYSNQSKSLTLKQKISQMLFMQEESLKNILKNYSINLLPQFLTLMRQSTAILKMKQTVNLTKKLTVECIKQQKQIISQRSVPNLIWNFAAIDLTYYMQRNISKFSKSSLKGDKSKDQLMRKIIGAYLLPYQVLPYNSVLFFIYHQLATFTHAQMHVLSQTNLSKIVQGLAIVSYKNQSLYDELAQKIIHLIDKIDLHDKPIRQQQLISKVNQIDTVKSLFSIICCYGFQRRMSPLYLDCIQRFFQNLDHKIIVKLPTNLLLRTLTILVSLQSKKFTVSPYGTQSAKILQRYILPYLDILIDEERSALLYTMIELHQYFDPQKINTIISRNQFNTENQLLGFLVTFWKYYQEVGKELEDDNAARQLLTAENKLNRHIQKDILKKQQNAGCALPYPKVYTKIHEKLLSAYDNDTRNVVAKTWRIQVHREKTVYFIGSYEHLATQNVEDKQKLMLFGIWRLYSKVYEKRGWKMELVCSFLEG